MNAYVINQDQIKQYIAIAIAALVLSFIFGYIVGNIGDKSDQVAVVDTGVEPIVASDVDSSSIDENESAIKSADKTINKPVTKKTGDKTKAKQSKSDNKKAAEKKPEQKKIVKKVAPKKVAKAKPKPVKKEKPKEVKTAAVKQKVKTETKQSAKNSTDVKKSLLSNIAATNKQPQLDVSTLPNEMSMPKDEVTDGKRLYSIQAGMFASKTNALSFIEKLSAQKFDAYVTDFVSTSGAVKYNVRVGRFEERDKAREKLQDYQKYFSTPAYVVISQ